VPQGESGGPKLDAELREDRREVLRGGVARGVGPAGPAEGLFEPGGRGDDEQIEHSAPFIAKFNAEHGAGVTLRGKTAVSAYFGRALASNPTPPGVTRFDPMDVTAGTGSVLVVYRRWTGEIAGEVFFLNAAGLIVRSVSHYG
jgi:hypothetical protein